MKTLKATTFFAFVSGIAALIYQVIWIRQFSLVFGVHIFSVSAVLTTFMAGLAIGSYLIGKMADRIQWPLLLFIVIEIIIALFGFFFDNLLDLATKYYLLPDYSSDRGYILSHAIRFTFSFLILIVPTTLMGGTIPLLSKLYVHEMSAVGKKVSLLYGLNNLGAFTGAFLAGFVLIRIIGVQNSILFAAGLNLVNALIAAIIVRKFSFSFIKPKESEIIEKPGKPDKLLRISLAVFAIEGFTTLAYEVTWTRILQEFAYEKTVYFNTAIILSFIAGLGLGSLIIKNQLDNLKSPYKTLSLLQIFIGLSSFLIFLLFLVTSPFVHQIRFTAQNWTSLAIIEYGYYFLLLITPALFMGMTFPLMAVIFNKSLADLGKRMGIIGFLDTIGSVFGALIAGFILLPLLGTFYSLMVVVLINVLAGIWLLNSVQRKFKIAWALPATVFLWLAIVFFMPDNIVQKGRSLFYPNEEIVAYEEGISANVAIYQEDAQHLALAINGAKTAFSNIQDLKVHKMLAYLPLALHYEAEEALVIGFGMGVTANELIKAGLNVEVAELSPEVAKLSAYHFSFLLDAFAEQNKPKLILEDGRSYLFRTDKKFDIITSNAIHSRLGVNLYTKEFYELGKSRLTQGGILCQWLPTNWLEKDEFLSLMHAFQDVFPNAQLWFVTRGHCLLVGANGPYDDVWMNTRRLYENDRFRTSLMDVEISSPAQFLAQLFIAEENMENLLQDAPVNTDNDPLVEYSRNISLKPSPEILTFIKQNHTGYTTIIPDTVNQGKTKIYNTNFTDEIQQYLNSYGS